MTTIIKLKRKGVGGSDPTPSDLEHGELAINFADGKLYYKNSSNAIAQFLDSGQTVSMIDSAYINDRINSDYLDSAEAINLMDSAYVNARLDRSLFLDSAEAIQLVDSAYVNARLDDTLFMDSAEVINLVDSAYVNARLDDTLFLDSAEAHNILDSMFGNLDQHLVPITTEIYDLGDSTRRFRDLYLSGTSVTFGNIVMSEHNGAARFTNHTTGDEVKIDVSNVNTHLIDSSVILDVADSNYVKTVQYLDDEKAIFGTGDDLQIWHNATNSIIQNSTGQLQLRGNTVRLLNAATTKDLALFNNGGSVDLYYDGDKKLETTTYGATVTGSLIADSASVTKLRLNNELVDSAWVNARLDTTSFLDSAEAINLVDSAYVNARLNSALFLDSAEAVNLIDSAHVVLRAKNLENTLTLTSTDAGSAAGPELILYRNSASPADADYLGQIQFKGRQDGPGDEIYAKVTGKISDATSGTEDGLIETAIKGNGSFTIVSRQKSDELQLLNGVGLSVDGSLTLGGNTVDSAWVQARQLNFDQLLDSAEATNLIDSSYIQARTRIGLDNIDFGSKTITYSNVYATTGDLPSASTYHGMFAHVHATGRGYFAHGGNWIPLANQSELFSGAWADVTGKPTTIAGYGITDAMDSALITQLVDSAYVQAREGDGTFGLAGNTGTHTFNPTTETLTFLGTTGQINAGIAANNVTLELDPNINSIVSIAFEGDSANAHEIKLQATNPTADRTINLPDATGHLPVFATASPAAITDGTNGQALVTDGNGQLSFTTISGGGGGTVDSASTITLIQNTVDSAYVTARATLSSNTLTLQDEGTPLLNDTTNINFVGSGVTVSGTTTTKTVTISGGGGGGSANVNTDVVVNTFNGDSSTTAFTLSSEPSTDQNVFVTINGVSQHVDAYSVAGTTLTLSAAPENGDVVEARTVRSTNVELRDHKDYIYQPNPASLVFSGSDVNGDVLSYDVDKLEVFFNGSRLTPGLDFTATNGTSVTILADYNADSNDTVVISSFSKASLVDIGLTPGSATIGTAATQYVADTYSATTHRTSKYLIELAIDSDNKYHSTEVLLTHNGTTVFMSQYGHVTSDSSLGEFDADINSGNVRLLVTPSLNNTTIKTQRITIGA